MKRVIHRTGKYLHLLLVGDGDDLFLYIGATVQGPNLWYVGPISEAEYWKDAFKDLV